MSLDVYLESDLPVFHPTREAIFVRRDGATVEISREEWDALYPGRDPIALQIDGFTDDKTIFHRNITHNLGRMAAEAGIYEACWRPDEINIHCAEQLVPLLAHGLQNLRADPDRFRKFNPENEWGSYEGLVDFVDAYLSACRKHPGAKVRVWR